MTSLAEVCQEWLRRLPTWTRSAKAGGGLTAVLVTRQLLYSDLLTRWPDAPPLTARLSFDDESELRGYLRWSAKRVQGQLALLRTAIDEGLAEALERDVYVTVTLLADKLVRMVARFEASGRPISATELAAVASTFLDNRPPRGRKLKREAFAEHEPAYLRQWEKAGAPHLAALPYSRLLLGDDERPAFVRAGRENVSEGLGRSVYSRFSMAAGDAKVAGSAHEVARAEVARACGRLGLEHESMVVALHSLMAGFTFGPVDERGWKPPETKAIDRTWRDDPEPLVATSFTIEDDSGRPRGNWVNADMAEYAQATVATFANGTNQGRYLRKNAMMEVACRHAMRRGWMTCFQFDRRGEIIDGTAGAHIVFTAINKGIPEGESLRIKAVRLGEQTPVILEKRASTLPAGGDEPAGDAVLTGDAGLAGDAGPAEGRTASAVDPARLERTLAWLAHDRERTALLIERDDEVVAEYERAVAAGELVPFDYIRNYFKEGPE